MRKNMQFQSTMKKVVSIALTIAMVSSSSCTNVMAGYAGDKRTAEAVSAVQQYLNDLNSDMFRLEESTIMNGVDTSSEEEQSIIVEFKSDPVAVSRAAGNARSASRAEADVEEEHEIFENFVANLTSSRAKSGENPIKHSYTYIYNGVSMTIKGDEIESLLDSGVVKAIWPNEAVALSPDEQIVSYTEEEVSPYMNDSTGIIGSDILNVEGITGEGVKVAVLDTGIDYNHPDLEGVYKGGYDFVDEDTDPMETTYESLLELGYSEEEAMNYATYHGTHVAGTIAATGSNDSKYSVTGVAPGVELYAYRVLGLGGSGSTDDIIAAIEMAAVEEMDVINLSLGTSVNNVLYPTSVAINNATIAGVVCCVANGNDGPEYATVASPGCAPLAISVGATTNGITVDSYDISLSNGLTINGDLLISTFQDIDLTGSYKLEYCGNGALNASDYTDSSADMEFGFKYYYDDDRNPVYYVAGKIAVIDRGSIALITKIKNAFACGAVGVILINNTEDEHLGVYLGEFSNDEVVPAIAISSADGAMLKAAMGSDTNLTASCQVNGSFKVQADDLAEFSSRGPASDMTIKPDVCAPGQGIMSTYPSFVNSKDDTSDYSIAYGRISGTSMATPHVTGVVALMIQSDLADGQRDLTPEDIKTQLMNTCDPLASDYGINEMGAGRINAERAVYAATQFEVVDTCKSTDEDGNTVLIDYLTGSLSFDLITKSEDAKTVTKTIEIQNVDSKAKTFATSVRFLGTETGDQDAYENGVQITIDPVVSVVTGPAITADAVVVSGSAIDAGSAGTVSGSAISWADRAVTTIQASITIPADAAVGRYEGIITFMNVDDPNETYTMPFSASYTVPGFNVVELSRPAATNDLEWINYAMIEGITANVSVNSLFDECYVYVSEYDNPENVFGYVGYADLFGAAPGGDTVSFNVFGGRLAYFPLEGGIDGKLTFVRHSLTEGKYLVSFIGTDNDGNTYRRDVPFLVDNTSPEAVFDNIEPGLVSLSEDMFEWDPEYFNYVFWITGHVTDDSIAELNSMGYTDLTLSDIMMPIFVGGSPAASVPVQEDGSFRVGVTKDEVEMNQLLEIAPHPVDIATCLNLYKIPRYYLVLEDQMFMEIGTDVDYAIKEGDSFDAVITGHNLTDASRLEMTMQYYNAFEVNDIAFTQEFKDLLSEKNYTAELDVQVTGTLLHSLKLTIDLYDEAGERVQLGEEEALTIPMIAVNLTYVEDETSEFHREYLELDFVDLYDKSYDEEAKWNMSNWDMAYACVDTYVDVIQQNSYLLIPEMAEGFYDDLGTYQLFDQDDETILAAGLDQYVWIEGPDGTIYHGTYDPSDTVAAYIFNDLPISDQYFTVHTEVPGHFAKEATFIPSRCIGGELTAINYYMLGSEFYYPVYAGDANGDGVVDTLDAEVVASYWKQEVDFREVGADFNFDGIVNDDDMDYIIKNFGASNEQQYPDGDEVIHKTTESGKTLNDILKEIGYTPDSSSDDERFIKIVGGGIGSTIQMALGDTMQMEVTVTPEDANVDIQWSSKNPNVVSIDEKTGLATAVNTGRTLIVAEDRNSDAISIAYIAVLDEDGNYPTLNKVTALNKEISIKVGETAELEFKVDPENYTFGNVSYVTTNSRVSVADGVITGEKAGICYVTADVEDGKGYVTWKVIVTEEEGKEPTATPTTAPTGTPGVTVSPKPTETPVVTPTAVPTQTPELTPTVTPTTAPTATPVPTKAPSSQGGSVAVTPTPLPGQPVTTVVTKGNVTTTTTVTEKENVTTAHVNKTAESKETGVKAVTITQTIANDVHTLYESKAYVKTNQNGNVTKASAYAVAGIMDSAVSYKNGTLTVKADTDVTAIEEAAKLTTKDMPLQTILYLPTKQITALADKYEMTTMNIQVIVPDALSAEETVALNSIILSKEAVKALKGKQVSVVVKNETGNVLTVLTVSKEELSKAKTVTLPVNAKVTSEALSENVAIAKQTIGKTGVTVTVAQSKFPVSTTIKQYIGTEAGVKGKKVYVYRLNEENGLLEAVSSDNTYQVTNTGYLTFTVKKGGSYVVLTTPLADVFQN